MSAPKEGNGSTASNNNAHAITAESLSNMKIPPFGGSGGEDSRGGSSRGSCSWKGKIPGGQVEGGDDQEEELLIVDSNDQEDDSCSTQTSSSVGVQSNFIKTQIQKQKWKGNWNNSIAPNVAAPSSVDNAVSGVPSSSMATTRSGSDIKVSEEDLEDNEVMSEVSENSSSSEEEMWEGEEEDSVLDVPIRPSRSETSLARMHLMELNTENQKKKSGVIEENNSDEEEDSVLDVPIRPSRSETSLARMSLRELNIKNQKRKSGVVIDDNNSGGLDNEPKQGESNNANTNVGKQEQQAGMRRITDPPFASTNTDASSDDLARSNSDFGTAALSSAGIIMVKQPATVKRVLSTTSLVSMLKIQSICEKNELHDDIEKYNLAETVKIDSNEGGSDNVSEVTTTVDDDDDRDDDILDISDKSNDGGGGDGGNEQQQLPSKTSTTFLPFQPSIEDLQTANTTAVKKQNIFGDNTSQQSQEQDSMSTFYLQSITSAENITHASDAPDYDYYSISSSEDGDNVDELPGSEKQRQQHQQNATTTTATATAATDTNTAAVTNLSKEVCQVLGLPKDNLRKVHRGIMSRDTELQLRRMAGKAAPHGGGGRGKKEEPGNDKRQEAAQIKKTGESSGDHPSTPKPKNGSASSSSDIMTKKRSDDSSSSSDDSMDLAFGRSGSQKELDKWESIRIQRQSNRRNSMKKENKQQEHSPGGTIETGVESKGHTDATATSSSKSKSIRDTRLRQPPTAIQRESEVEENDSRSDVSSSSVSMVNGLKSRLGSMYRRISLTTYNEIDNGNIDNDDDNSSSSSSSSSDDEHEYETCPSVNILSEGEYYVAMSMLVYIYALLRETSLLGHTDIAFDEIDVNSFQSDPSGAFGNGSGSESRRSVKNYSFLSKTKSAGYIIRVVMDELEKKEAFSNVEKNEGDMCVMNEFKQWVHDSRSRQLDSATEQTIKELRRKVARRRWKRAIQIVRVMVRLGHSSSNSFSVQVAQRRKSSISASSLGGLQGATTTSMEELTKAIQKPPTLPRALGGSMMWMHDQRNQIMKSLGISSGVNLNHNLIDESEIKEIINDALEEPRFFIEGSLLSNLIESGIEVVYFGDRHPNDVVYSICCNRQFKRVSVVFRGTVNSHNWVMNMKFAQAEHPNPITEDYPGRTNSFGLHTGFSLYMTRQRKDDSLTKIEEIFQNIDKIGRELSPEGDYELSITGHSLGGALATILAFYAATSNAFDKVKTIRLFTYAAPRVGCQRFLYAVQHLEMIGKLRVARFTNTCDIVPLIPFHGFSRSYKHVGMHIRLLGADKYAQYWLRKALDISYPKNHGFWSQLWRGLLSSFIRNLNTVQGYKRNHTLSEYQRRIRFAHDYRSVLSQSGFFLRTKKRRCLKSLDEYYFIKGASDLTCTSAGELTRIALEDRAKEGVRREARKLIIVIALIALLEAVVLLGVLKHFVLCENYPILLYPLYLLTGCRNAESAKCTMVNEMAEMPLSLQQNMTTAPSTELPPNNDVDDNEANVVSISEEKLGSWTFWMTLPWKTPHSSHLRPACVWGHCNFRSRPYLPWGIRKPHLPLPAITIDSWSFDSDPETELFWDVEELFSKDDL